MVICSCVWPVIMAYIRTMLSRIRMICVASTCYEKHQVLYIYIGRRGVEGGGGRETWDDNSITCAQGQVWEVIVTILILLEENKPDIPGYAFKKKYFLIFEKRKRWESENAKASDERRREPARLKKTAAAARWRRGVVFQWKKISHATKEALEQSRAEQLLLVLAAVGVRR